MTAIAPIAAPITSSQPGIKAAPVSAPTTATPNSAASQAQTGSATLGTAITSTPLGGASSSTMPGCSCQGSSTPTWTGTTTAKLQVIQQELNHTSSELKALKKQLAKGNAKPAPTKHSDAKAQPAKPAKAAHSTPAKGASAAGGASAAQINSYLKSKGSPLAGQGATFVAAGKKNGIDPRLLVAISGAESGFGKNCFRLYNAWGWMGSHFTSWSDAINTVAAGLKDNYVDDGLTSVSSIAKKYCPVGAANDPKGLNAGWPKTVSQFLTEQGGNPANVRLS